DVAKLDDRAVAWQCVGRHWGCQSALTHDALALRQCDTDRDRRAPAAPVRIADGRPAGQRADRIVHVSLLDAVIFEIVLVDGDANALRAIAEAVLDVDDEGY